MDDFFVAVLKLLDHLIDVDFVLRNHYLALVTLGLTLAAVSLEWIWGINVVILIGIETPILVLIRTGRQLLFFLRV